MSLYQTLLAKVYPQDKANHYMRGSWAAHVGSSVMLVAFGFVIHSSLLPSRIPQTIPLSVMIAVALIVAAVFGALCAFGVGRLKESMDKKANDAADAKGEPRPHGVETADWQFTAWGAAPVSFTLLVGAVAFALV